MTEVLSKNLFALLQDDADEVAPVASTPAASKKEDKKAKKPEAAAPEKPVDNTRAKPGENRIRNEYRRGGGGYRGATPPATDAPNGVRGDGEGRYERRDGERGGERGTYRGRGRGGRGGRGGFRGREFDRHSGNDRYDGEKKEVAGKGTWGDAVEAATDPAVVAEGAEGAAAAEGAEATENVSPTAEAAAEKEPEEVLKTYEQYQAELAAKRAALASVNVRKANEGADDGQWKDAVPLAREDEDEDLFAGKTSKGKKTPAAKEKPAKVLMEIEQRFAADERERRGGGRGRGEGRGRGGEGRGEYRGRGRGPRQSNNFVNVGDETAFPSLGAK